MLDGLFGAPADDDIVVDDAASQYELVMPVRTTRVCAPGSAGATGRSALWRKCGDGHALESVAFSWVAPFEVYDADRAAAEARAVVVVQARCRGCVARLRRRAVARADAARKLQAFFRQRRFGKTWRSVRKFHAVLAAAGVVSRSRWNACFASGETPASLSAKLWSSQLVLLQPPAAREAVELFEERCAPLLRHLQSLHSQTLLEASFFLKFQRDVMVGKGAQVERGELQAKRETAQRRREMLDARDRKRAAASLEAIFDSAELHRLRHDLEWSVGQARHFAAYCA